MKHGNQYASRKTDLMALLRAARMALLCGSVGGARGFLYAFHVQYAKAPASTRRRWRCGN